MIPKKVTRIYKLINKIASKGKNNILEYKVLVDDLVVSGDFDNLLQCLDIYYKLNVYKLNTVADVKNKTWTDIMLNTNNNFTTKLNKLFKSKAVYQIGVEVFDDITNLKLGELREIGSYNDEAIYLVKNKEFAKLTKTRRDFVEVLKDNIYTLFNQDNSELSEDENLYNRYVNALNLLKP